MNKRTDFGIVIYSCWKNNDMWDVFSFFINKFWKDCPYSIILVTDKAPKRKKNWCFNQIIEYDSTWGDMILYTIEKCGLKYVSLWMDDYLLCDYVDNNQIDYSLLLMEKYKAAMIKLYFEGFEKDRKVTHAKEIDDSKLKIVPYKRAYALSLQGAIWDVEFLIKHIVKEWSAWDFERIGSMQIEDEEKKLYTYSGYIIPYIEGVRQGKWMQQGAELCIRNQIALNSKKRKVMTNWDMAKIYFKGAILDLNPSLIVRMQNVFLKIIKKR